MSLSGCFVSAVVGALCLGGWFAFGIVYSAYRKRHPRARFVAGRPPLSDEEFLRRCGAPPERARVCLGVRRGIANVAWFRPEAIDPSDQMSTLAEMGMNLGDWVAVEMSIEEALGIRITWWVTTKAVPEKMLETITVGEFGLRLGEVMGKEGLLGDLGTYSWKRDLSQPGTPWLVLMGLLVGIPLVIYSVNQTRRILRQKRAAFMAGRAAVSDEEFLRGCGAPPERRRVYLAVRRVVAREVEVPPEFISPGDRMYTLAATNTKPYAWGSIVSGLEKALGIRLMKVFDRKSLVPSPETITVGDFGLWLGEVLEKEGLLGKADM